MVWRDDIQFDDVNITLIERFFKRIKPVLEIRCDDSDLYHDTSSQLSKDWERASNRLGKRPLRAMLRPPSAVCDTIRNAEATLCHPCVSRQPGLQSACHSRSGTINRPLAVRKDAHLWNTHPLPQAIPLKHTALRMLLQFWASAESLPTT